MAICKNSYRILSDLSYVSHPAWWSIPAEGAVHDISWEGSSRSRSAANDELNPHSSIGAATVQYSVFRDLHESALVVCATKSYPLNADGSLQLQQNCSYHQWLRRFLESQIFCWGTGYGEPRAMSPPFLAMGRSCWGTCIIITYFSCL